ncbi:MAG TPA: phage regulatory CII family protein [Steroidobacter sp.]|uniref:phage regulatory CII family protein n=1 Tax=Steroidobacter sp. TaxID=1978227 RepID=UPI002ED95C48
MRIVSENQLTLELQPNLLRRFSTLRQCVHHTALNYQRGMKELAADLDLSESELSRRLNPSDGDHRSCDVNLMVQIVEKTNDLTPIHWLMAKFLSDAESQKQAAMNALVQMAPQMLALFVEAGLVPQQKPRRRE